MEKTVERLKGLEVGADEEIDCLVWGQALDGLVPVLGKRADASEWKVEAGKGSKEILMALDLSVCWLPGRVSSRDEWPSFLELYADVVSSHVVHRG